MHNINLDREILKLIEEQPEISERDIARTLSVSEELVKVRIANLHDIREKILIMGNRHNVHQTLMKVLDAENYNVVNASDSFPALETVNTERPDLVLLDTAFLNTDGFEICRQLKASPRCCWVPVMMLSERDKAEDSIKAFKSGADDYVAEPFNPLELKARVGMILRRNRI
ncbi:response regulator receiver protein [Methanosarcina sp. 2.H.T.1A.6]|uniref:response regulator n=1 Tax=unclassified Methanosarcina TaxID=2644672 RepID=UPI0006228838|nr:MULTISPECIES: response regulator [unclassified Methanosarcina]KKG14980.1 response regulator receiver protein [Methanosarcina sp. 2.H.T.1A.3]KKG20587.1 response regulator receiver protein [Methanosarcina sp. 2.H.T.1A.8]KKG21996.1 response regulator receiver protein [Methanosarcina sp. 2.H.T.1A.6]KKG28633.1 response regulator receiver protein [Methanosarcina sp. 2.H.T.1A.15]